MHVVAESIVVFYNDLEMLCHYYALVLCCRIQTRSTDHNVLSRKSQTELRLSCENQLGNTWQSTGILVGRPLNNSHYCVQGKPTMEVPMESPIAREFPWALPL